MGKLTLADLRKLRESSKKGMEMRDSENKGARIIISMGTCGIAAGAKETFDAFIEQLMARGMTCQERGTISTETKDCTWAQPDSALAQFTGKELSDHNACWAICKFQ